MAAPEDGALASRVSRGARRAAMLRGAVGVLTLTLLALGAGIAA